MPGMLIVPVIIGKLEGERESDSGIGEGGGDGGGGVRNGRF